MLCLLFAQPGELFVLTVDRMCVALDGFLDVVQLQQDALEDELVLQAITKVSTKS